MSEWVYSDVFGADVVLTDQVCTTILAKHPETQGLIERIDLVLRDPDEVRQSVKDERKVLYYRFESDV
jgi:hypothetical protein